MLTRLRSFCKPVRPSVTKTRPSLPLILTLADDGVIAFNNGGFLRQILSAILEPSTFWSASMDAYSSDRLDSLGLEAFAWLCLQVVSDQTSFESQKLEVDQMMERQSLLKSQLPQPQSATQGITPGGRHDNDHANFRQVSIYPTSDELTSTDPPSLQRLGEVFDAPMNTRSQVYRDWLFRLLREDMLSELRDDLQVAMGRKKSKRKPVTLGEMKLVNIDVDKTTMRHIHPYTYSLFVVCGQGVNFPRNMSRDRKVAFVANSKHFMKHDSFGALCCDDKVIAFGSLVRSDANLLKSPPIVGLRFTDSSLIQGPPGTGKSFLGAIILLTILRLGVSSDQIVRLGSKSTDATKPTLLHEYDGQKRYWLTMEERNILNALRVEETELDEERHEYSKKLAGRGVSPADILEYLEFSESFTSAWSAFQVPDDDGFQMVDSRGKVIEPEAVYDYWLRNGDIKGMGRLNDFLEGSSPTPDIILVEEAGEILDAHIITAMSASVKQLILIGDHKQLRPKIGNYALTKEKGEGYDLNVSLFERLITQGRHFTALQE
ncbi:hypothetical protein FSST1_005010 [Fusarium sambucinum]